MLAMAFWCSVLGTPALSAHAPVCGKQVTPAPAPEAAWCGACQTLMLEQLLQEREVRAVLPRASRLRTTSVGQALLRYGI